MGHLKLLTKGKLSISRYNLSKLVNFLKAKNEGASGVNGNRLGRKSSDEKKRARMNKSNLITPDRVNINNTCIAIWDHVTCDEDELQFR